VSLMSVAKAEVDCQDYLQDDPASALRELNEMLATTREEIATLRATIEKGAIVLSTGETMTYEEAISRVVVWVLNEHDFDDDEALEKELWKVTAIIAVFVKRQGLALKKLERDLTALARCHIEVQSVAAQDTANAIGGMSLRVTVGEDEDFMRSSSQHITISKSETSVSYLWEALGCAVTWIYDIGGAPTSLKRGDEFAISLKGSVSGECSSAGGFCRPAMVALKGGLEKAKDGVAMRINTGVPKTGKAASKSCHIASDTISIPLRATSDSSAGFEFRIGHGSGSKLVAAYKWGAAEE